MKNILPLFLTLTLVLFCPICVQAKPEEGKDWVEVPTIGDGLCVNNLFQSNMVIQRDKPVRVWGWASVGEKVTVSFAGQTKTVEAGRSRSWQVELSAMEASSSLDQPSRRVMVGA